MIWATMDYDSRLAVLVQLARDGNSVGMIARVLSTSNENVWELAREHSVYIHSSRPGHAVPAVEDKGMSGGDPFVRKMAVWRRSTQGARETRLAHESNMGTYDRTYIPVDETDTRSDLVLWNE